MKNLTLVTLMLGVMMVLVVNAVSAATIFSDGFESNDFSAWTQADNDWYTSSVDPHSGSYASYTADQGQNPDVIRREVSTVGYNSIVFSYWYKIPNSIESGEHVYAEWYDGSTWHTVADYTSEYVGSWTHESFNLPSGATNNPNFEIRFKSIYLDEAYHDLFKLDDVKVDGTAIGDLDCNVNVDLSGPGENGWFTGPIDVHWDYDPSDCPIQPHQYVDLDHGLNSYNLNYFLDTATRNWQWNPVNDGEEGTGYSICLDTEIKDSSNEAEGCSDDFKIDTSDPVIDDLSGECNEGETLHLHASAYDVVSGIDSGSWEWDLDNDGNFGESGEVGQNVDYFCADGDALETVHVRVSDNAGNSAGENVPITIHNVNPVCESISGPSPAKVLVGEEVDFSGSASDVAADIPLAYHWDFGDESSLDDGSDVSHTYNTVGTYQVDLGVTDKDGGSDLCDPFQIQVVEPTPITDQEVAAFYPLVAEFNDGSANNKFMHGLSGASETCEKLSGPDNLVVSDEGGDTYCTIFWDRDHTANPTNAERGNHEVLFKVVNDTDVEYYSFNVMVYSWIIPLDSGWNLISIPLMPQDSSKPGDVFDSNGVGQQIDQIWSYEYDSETGESEWKCVQPTSSIGSQCGPGITKITEIEPGRAYWVKLADEEESAVVKGMGLSPSEIQGPVLPPSVDVPTNAWSLIGRYGIVGKDYTPFQSDDRRVHGYLPENVALDSLTKVDNDMHVYDELFTAVHNLFNNEGYWLWVEDNANGNSGYESYAPIDDWYPKNSGESVL